MGTHEIYNAVLNLNKEEVLHLIKVELDAGTNVTEILNNGLISALDEVGRRFSDGVIFVPEMIVAGKVVESALDVLRPVFTQKDVKPKGSIVIGTVKGDLHDIGKNLVSMVLEGSGFEVTDLGVDITPEGFTQAIKNRQPDMLAMSALLTTTMPMMKQTIDAIKGSALRDSIKILIGGPAVTQKFSDDINADGFAEDAPGAVKKARELLQI